MNRHALASHLPFAHTLLLGALAAGVLNASAPLNAESWVNLSNNQPFDVRMPVCLRGVNLEQGAVPTTVTQRVAAQQVGKDLYFLAELPASSSRAFAFSPDTQLAATASSLKLTPGPQAVSLQYAGKNLGKLSWALIMAPAPKRSSRSPEGDDMTPPVRDFASSFSPLPLAFEKKASGAVFDSWQASVTTQGLTLGIEVQAYHNGFVDLRGTLTNDSLAPPTNTYCAVVCRWEQPQMKERSLCYNSEVTPFGETTSTTFRAGEGHHLALVRGVDWVRTSFQSGLNAAWLYDFTESFTLHDTSSKKGGRWTNANQPQLGQEAQSTPGNFYSITEISRANIRRYRDRFASYVLPAKGESTSFASRLAFALQPLTDKQADSMFVGYTCYKEQHERDGRVDYALGVPYVRFGTAYFPYSTLGENFDLLKLPGMDREGYWPLAADTVNQWKLFAEDIRRDLRIAKAFGFDIIRLHHLELLSPIDPKTRQEYLDFLFAQMHELGLKALVDIQMTPEEVADLVKRYRDTIDGIEVENEILIYGIKDGREKYWNAVYDAVKAVAPEMPVHLTAHCNTGIFPRLFELGGKSDKIGFHSYIDTTSAISSGRDLALAVGNYAGKCGRPVATTEWNWRFLTRMPFEERAKIYPEIMGAALKTRSVSDFYQFQFNDTLAVNPRVGLAGIRHYEPIFLSRRPKPEAFELMELIALYSRPDHPVRQIEVSHAVASLDKDGKGECAMRVRNVSGKELELKAVPDALKELSVKLTGEKTLRLSPGQEATLKLSLEASQGAAPGFYHFFVRLEGADGFLRYGWGEARLAGKAKFDTDTPTTVTYPRGVKEELSGIDFSKPTTVVYGQGAPIPELETAVFVAQTLESATGRPVGFYELGTLPEGVRQKENLVLIGTKKSNALIAEAADKLTSAGAGVGAQALVARTDANGKGAQWLVLGGKDSFGAEQASFDFLLRYWRNAKDSATRKLGGKLSSAVLPKGADATKLP